MTEAIVSLISNGTGFLKGVVGLKCFLNSYAPSYTHALIVEQDKYKDKHLDYLRNIGYTLHIVAPLRSLPCGFAASRWPFTFTKLRLWELPYTKVLYIDADAAPFSSVQPILNVDCTLGATSTRRCATRFRSGMLLIQPNIEIFNNLQTLLNGDPTKNGAKLGDQGVLNIYFKRQFTSLPHHFHFVDWGWKVPHDIIIGHLRPKPWVDTTKVWKSMAPFTRQWKAAYNQMIEHFGPL
tara:strand:- start:253 stop:963 length:711 start_codon:yes stop_codon:yes gene_type:complete